MPYVNKWNREMLADFDGTKSAMTLGELNFQFHALVFKYLGDRGLSYDNIAGITGVLENVKQELYRRSFAPYEDQKIMDNGDVYPEYMLPNQPMYTEGVN